MSAALPSAPCCECSCNPATTTLVPGPTGDDGANGAAGTNGVNAYTALTAQFVLPALAATGAATVASNVWMAYGQILAIGDPAGAAPYAYVRVGAKTGTTLVDLTNLETAGGAYGDNVVAGTIFPVGTILSPGGLQGQAGADGASGAPDSAAYITATANASLSGEISLGLLTTGLLKISVAAGVATPSTASPGTDYLAVDAELTAIAGLVSAADRLPYFTGAGTAALATFTAFGRSLVDDAAAVNGRATLGAAASGANSDITSLTALSTPLSIAQGGTSGATAAAARTALGIGGGPIVLADKKATTVAGGTFTAGSWQIHDVNTEVSDPDNLCTVAGNQFTLLEGKYHVFAACPAHKTNQHQARLYNVTTAAVVTNGYGTNADSLAAGDDMTASVISTVITVPNPSQIFRIEHQATTTRATDGFGSANSFGGDEIYMLVTITRYY